MVLASGTEALAGPGKDLEAIEFFRRAFFAVLALVIGVWAVAFEYGQGTLRRTLSTDPRRLRLALSKILVAALFVSAITVLFYLLSMPAFQSLAAGRGESLSSEFMLRMLGSALIYNLALVLVGSALALLTTSMAGAIAVSVVWIFILDPIVGAVKATSDFGFGQALGKFTGLIEGDPAGSLLRPGAVLAGWLLLLLLVGLGRFLRSDVR